MSTPHRRRSTVLIATALTGAVALTALAPGLAQASAPAPATAPGAASHGGPGWSDRSEAANKRLVLTYYDGLFNKGDVTVVDRLVRPDFIQHNPQSSGDLAELKSAVAGFRKAFPQSHVDFYQVLAQGDLVAVHARVRTGPTDPGQAAFDIFRIQGGRIAEHWDSVQPVTPSVSGNDMFSTLSRPTVGQPDQRASERLTASVGTAFFDQVFEKKDPVGGFDRYARNYRQHNPLVADGAEAAKAALTAFYTQFPDAKVNVKRTIVDGDLILFHSNIVPAPGQLGAAVVDLFRVRDGKIVEHWDTVQTVPATSLNDNGMF